MYLVSSFLLLFLQPCSAFVVVQPPPNTNRQAASSSSSSSSALFASRRRDKIASRTAWLEKRGGAASATTTTTTTTASTTTTSTESAGAAGLRTNDAGLEYVQLVHPETGDSAQIYLYGACVTSYIKDNQEYIAVRPDAKMDGSKPISGGLSHCWPQFGPGAIQQHGFARNVNWEVGSAISDTSVEMILQPTDYTKEMWDKPFQVRFTVTLEADQLVTEMVVENTSSSSSDSDAFDFQAALHSYFTVSSLENLQIAGSFAGKEFLNKIADATETEDRDVITIAEEYDRVYKGVNDPVLNDQGTGKSLAVLNKEGWEDTVIWNPYGNEGMGYNNFVCVESVKFDPVTLEAGKTWTGVMALKPASL